MNGSAGTDNPGTGCNVYVASLPPDFDDEQLFNLFAPYGRICSARIMRSKGARQSRGYGFVLYKDPRSAEMAISSLVGCVVQGNKIQVRMAHPDASNAYTGQRGSRSNNASPNAKSLQLPQTAPVLVPVGLCHPALPSSGMPLQVPQSPDPTMVMTTYHTATAYPSVYSSVTPQVLQPAASPSPNVFSSQVMLLPQFPQQVVQQPTQQVMPQQTVYMVLQDVQTQG
ncbi:putative RNA recognition motif (a k a RRM RBD or RNP domain) [Trypanosoma vivax]|nr:putative RNA-binding protein 5 [Trypanosoma vivax]KAH8604874.1 putative RNA recognition motif (a k a RRM RBD or RNP domain) [Trypanosoma vivax]